MKLTLTQLKQMLSLAPAPLFVIGFTWSLWNLYAGHGHGWEMPIMWFAMTLAHLTPWIIRYQEQKTIYESVK